MFIWGSMSPEAEATECSLSLCFRVYLEAPERCQESKIFQSGCVVIVDSRNSVGSF